MAQATLEQLYDEHAQALFAFLLNLTRNEADTRDLLEQVFVKLAKEPTLLRKTRDPRGFLICLAHNLAIDAMRRRGTRDKNHQEFGTHLSIFASSTDPDEDAFLNGLSAGLAALPEEQRSVIHLKPWEGLTFEHRPHRGAAIAKGNGNRCPERSNERPGVGCVRSGNVPQRSRALSRSVG